MSNAADTARGAAPDAAAGRLRARYRAEWRFRAYGLIAIAAALGALATLISSIAVEAVPAFTEYRLTLDIPIDESIVDPQGRIAAALADETMDRDARAQAAEALIRRANFAGLLRAALMQQFPSVSDRQGRRELGQMLSPINAAALARRVARDPSLIGEVATVSMPIADDIDLHLKGAIETVVGAGTASPSGVSGEIEIVSGANDFAAVAAGLRERLAVEAARLESAAARARRDAERLAETDPEGEALQREFEARRLQDRADIYRERSETRGQAVELGPELPSVLVRINGGVVRALTLGDARLEGETLVLLESAGAAAPGSWEIIVTGEPEADRRITDRQIAWAATLQERGRLERRFNWTLFTNADSRDPELAGVRGAFIGSVLTMIITMALAAPIAVFAAIYLEEFAPRTWFSGLIEVNINNLAAVPSIVFGLLGLAVFINFMGLPRSAPLVGGLVLALMTLPTIIIATRAALKAVPPSVRSAALGLGASPVQTVFHHVLPLAMPGILTGSIIGLAQALGETAPLLMIGMVAFIADAPSGFTDAATVMPVQVFIWSNAAERAFEARTSAAILVLLSLMVALNLLAVYVRRRFERRW